MDLISLSLQDVFLKNLEDSQAEDVLCFNVADRVSFADWIIFASGRSTRQVSSIGDSLVKCFKKFHQEGTIRLEGSSGSGWLLVDAGYIVTHIFLPEIRTFYNIEEMWK